MTREEAIQVLQTVLTSPLIYGEFAYALDMAIEALSAEAVHIETYRELYEKYVELKHALAEAEWIPCSEKLPDKTGWYVATVEGFETITDMLFFYKEVSAWSDITDKQKVFAWMPLPKPYKESEVEE